MDREQRHLVGAPEAFDPVAVDLFRAVQPLGERSTIIGQWARAALPLVRRPLDPANLDEALFEALGTIVRCMRAGSSPWTK